MGPSGTAPATRARQGSLYRGMNWMGGLSLLLFWLPVFGPLIAGLVGGWKAGDLRRALLAVFLPAIGLGVLVGATIGWLTHLAFWGVLAGLGGVAVAFINIGPLLLGAVIGGVAASASRRLTA